jgi:hypothetical protein
MPATVHLFHLPEMSAKSLEMSVKIVLLVEKVKARENGVPARKNPSKRSIQLLPVLPNPVRLNLLLSKKLRQK